jgi:prevent-host-death family protein
VTSVGIAELKNQLSDLVERAGAGEEIVITKHGKPLARLVGAGGRSRVDTSALLKRMTDGRTATLGDLDWKELRDIGRR